MAVTQSPKTTGNGAKAKASEKKVDDIPFTITEEVKELPLEKVIDNTLAKNSVTKTVLNAMKKKYLVDAKADTPALKEEFVLKTPTDKETYLLIKEERKGVRKVGIITEKLCETGRADAIKIQKMWLDKQKEILGEVAAVQDQLDAQIKIFEDEQKRLEEEEEKRKDEQYNVRQSELIKMGAVIANGCLNINDLSIETNNIREADDEVYKETIFPLFKMHYEANEKKRVEEEEKKKKDQEEFDRKKKELDEQQEKMRQQQEEFDRKQQEFAKQQQQLKEQKTNSRKLQLEALGMTFSLKDDGYVFGSDKITTAGISTLEDYDWEIMLQKLKPSIEQTKKDALEKRQRTTNRAAKLSELGLTFTGNAYVFDDINIPATDLTGMEDENWNKLIATTTPMIEDRRKKAAKKSLGITRLETLKTIGLVKNDTAESLGELEEAEWITLSEGYKTEVKAAQEEQWKQQEEEKKRQQQKQQEEDAAKATDKEKWTALITTITSAIMPEFKSSVYKNKATQLTAKIKEIQAL